MVMTSVSGHLLNYEFFGQYKNWLEFDSVLLERFVVFVSICCLNIGKKMISFRRQGCNPVSLFDAPVRKRCPENFVDIKVGFLMFALESLEFVASLQLCHFRCTAQQCQLSTNDGHS